MKCLLLLLLFVGVAYTYYLPGLPQQTFLKGSLVKVKTRKITSSRNLPYDFYSLKFCRPDPIDVDFENLGEYFFGDRIENSVYNVCSDFFFLLHHSFLFVVVVSFFGPRHMSKSSNLPK